jgi:4-diphosphocytidyl-2-C-methyl-D-erythritol kinase
VVRAVRRLQTEAGCRDGIRFHLEKRIPSGAGLGGGSSDAATALRLANDLWGLGCERADLVRIGAEVGADVPFFLYGGTCLCEGCGERVTPLPEAVGLDLALVLPPWRTHTAAAYAALEERLDPHPVAPFMHALRRGDREAIARESYNRFEEVAGALEPRNDVLREALEPCGALCVRLSGSGSALWCLLPDGTGTDRLQAALASVAARSVRVLGKGRAETN